MALSLFFRTQDRVHGCTKYCDIVLSPKTLPAVAVTMFSCTTDSLALQISSPVLQGFVDFFGAGCSLRAATSLNAPCSTHTHLFAEFGDLL